LLQPNNDKDLVKVASQHAVTTPGGITEHSVASESEDLFSACQTYIYLTINLSDALFPEPT